MSLVITVGPPLLTISNGRTVFTTDPDGQIHDKGDKGLYFFDTRLVSSYRIFANGVPFDLLNAGAVTYYAASTYLTNGEMPCEDGMIPPRTLALVLSRVVSEGVHEDLDLTNHGAVPVRFNLEIAIRSDFADLSEVRAGRIVRRGHVTTEWDEANACLTTTYTNGDFRRALVLRAREVEGSCSYANGRVTFDVNLAPGRSWHACLHYVLVDGARAYEPPHTCIAHARDTSLGRSLSEWRTAALKIETPNEEFYQLFHQAIDDIGALRLPIEGADRPRSVLAAGVPWFAALFGRDSLIAALQTALVYPDFARGTLDVLGELQATERDDYRDAEPGKILHELRLGELAHFKRVPHTPYYGTADATPLYLILLHVTWRCTGDRGLLELHLATAERCLAWIDEWGDRDGDGFQEYETRSPAGYENQVWKDSGDGVLNPDGTCVKGPKALCELQGYVYDAWLRMAEIYDALARPSEGVRLREKARALHERFNAVFWDEASGYYAYCLDGDKRPVLTVASNPGHLLWSGIVPPDRAARVVARLMQPDMWSGWGIRTLSARHPAFNPFSYHNGSVWPHDNGFIALGFKRYGFAAEAARIARDISEAASFFALHQLPELYAGIERTAVNFPVQYLGANVPQAWAAGSAFAMLQALLGLEPDAAAGLLHVDPRLPDWMPNLTVRDLRVGGRVFDLRFRREGSTTRVEVLRGDPTRVKQRRLVKLVSE